MLTGLIVDHSYADGLASFTSRICDLYPTSEYFAKATSSNTSMNWKTPFSKGVSSYRAADFETAIIYFTEVGGFRLAKASPLTVNRLHNYKTKSTQYTTPVLQPSRKWAVSKKLFGIRRRS